jgi:hypothetical protein
MPTKLIGRPAAVFGPAEIANLTAAYATALSAIEEGNVRLEVPGHELRRKVALGIIEEAARGQSDPALLAERALDGLAAIP